MSAVKLLTRSLYHSICSLCVSVYILRSTDWLRSLALRSTNDWLHKWLVISSMISTKSVWSVRNISDKLNTILESLNLNSFIICLEEFKSLELSLLICCVDEVFKNPVLDRVNSLWFDHFWFILLLLLFWSSLFNIWQFEIFWFRWFELFIVLL